MVKSNTPLTVFKASAGSGKTFTLATEYIKLLVQNPQSYRHTLAVTFTNKATEEMKMRILSQLYGIWQQLPQSDSYARRVEEDLDASPQFVSQQAGIALHNLLHNYSYFRVETIDSFFQTILRNMAHELDLTTNLRVSLNDNQVEEQAVDDIIEELSPGNVILSWLLRYIMENIGEDRSWNVVGPIKRFGRTIFLDFYKQHSHELQRVFDDNNFFDRYTSTLHSLRQKAIERMKKLADDFFDTLDAEGLSIDDLSYGRNGLAGMFLKMRAGEFDRSIVGKRVADCLGQPDRWYKKTHPQRERIHQLADTTLGQLLRTAVDEQPRCWLQAKSAELTLRHISQLRLLGCIERKVRQLNDDANRFLLSDTQQLLHDIIDGGDSPFIFEKIGTRLDHIMIDEFQDTSSVQWQNFKVLLNELMSHGDSHNLIVGDVKQSIYRWRSGDWRLLAGITSQFDDGDSRVNVRSLSTNYRSARRVVDFNNAFFVEAASQEQVTAYDDVCQHVPDNKPDTGLVEVTLLPKTDYQSEMLNRLATDIKALIDTGTAATDIAILVRNNSRIPLIANHLAEVLPQLRVVSDEAFRLDASPAVVTIILALRTLTRPDDAISRAALALVCSGRLDGELPPDFDDRLLLMPLNDLVERLYLMFRLDTMPGQSAYLCAFYDCIAAFVNEQTTDVAAFLREWDENIAQKTIQSPEIDGLRLISIHKSKGLEFPHVFIPFCDWQLEHADILWCKPSQAPFDQLPLAPVDFSQKGMEGTIYEADYEEEHQQTTVDNLNLLYVAFTRAAESLHVYGRRDARPSRSTLLQTVLPQIIEQLDGARLTGIEDETLPLNFTYGDSSLSTLNSQHLQASDLSPLKNPFLIPPTPRSVAIATYSQKVEFRQSNQSRDFVSANDDADTEERTNYIQLGSVLHNVFSTIETTADIDKALLRLELDGIIYDNHITRPAIEQLIRQRLADPRVASWFGGGWTLYNECTILTHDPLTGSLLERRPDRVMTDGRQTIVVDFKFGREREEYHSQVRQYMQLLTDMGLPQVKGYLWLVYSNQILEVK